MSDDNTRPRWQFSLRSFLVAVLIFGPMAGVAGPILLESITEWKPKPRPLPARQKSQPLRSSVESEGYYESGETPLY